MSNISNDTTNVPKGIELNDRDYCTCLLTTLKDMEKNYVIAMTEASNEWLYNEYKDIFLKLSELQRELYTIMFQNGWYVMENVDSKKISDKYTMLENDYRSLSE